MKPGYYWARFKLEFGLGDWEPVLVRSNNFVLSIMYEGHNKINDFRWGKEIKSPKDEDKGKIA